MLEIQHMPLRAIYSEGVGHNEIHNERGDVVARVESDSAIDILVKAANAYQIMLEALQPFAALAAVRDISDPGMPDDFAIAAYVAEFRGTPVRITLGNCRSAALAIAKAEGR